MQLKTQMVWVQALLFSMALSAFGHSWSSDRPDGHAPIGVMGDHTHHAGEWMAAYRYKRMEMSGIQDGTECISRADVLSRYMMAPVEMSREMHAVGMMWAPTDRLTFTAMLPYLDIAMDGINAMGRKICRKTEGVGDARASAIIVLRRWNGQQLHLNAGISFPTGSIDEKSGGARLPYPLQIGSGTYDLLPGVTYVGQREQWSWGSQISGVLRLSENDNDYTLGDQLAATAWAARMWCDWCSTSLRLAYRDIDAIDGADPQLRPKMSPAADTANSGKQQLNAGLGINLYMRSGIAKGHRIAVEWETPAYSETDGIQLEADSVLTLGWQKSW